MKKEGALKMRFLRHVGIYRSDVSFLLFTPGAYPAFRSGRCQGIEHTGKYMPCPSSAMSSGRLFLDRVARQHCPSPLRRQGHHKTLDQRIRSKYHRTVRCGLSGCLTRGVHPTNKTLGVIQTHLVEKAPIGQFLVTPVLVMVSSFTERDSNPRCASAAVVSFMPHLHRRDRKTLIRRGVADSGIRNRNAQVI